MEYFPLLALGIVLWVIYLFLRPQLKLLNVRKLFWATFSSDFVAQPERSWKGQHGPFPAVIDNIPEILNSRSYYDRWISIDSHVDGILMAANLDPNRLNPVANFVFIPFADILSIDIRLGESVFFICRSTAPKTSPAYHSIHVFPSEPYQLNTIGSKRDFKAFSEKLKSHWDKFAGSAHENA